jgi:hypothetical protein
MAKFDSLYLKIEYNVKAALAKMDDLQSENKALRAERDRLVKENESLHEQARDVEDKLKILSVTKTILNNEDNKKTRKQINDWVREIDNCIALLKNK